MSDEIEGYLLPLDEMGFQDEGDGRTHVSDVGSHVADWNRERESRSVAPYSFSYRDLCPRFFDLEKAVEKLSDTRTEEWWRDTWNELRELSYSDLKALHDRLRRRSQAIIQRWRAENHAEHNSDDFDEKNRRFTGKHLAYETFLSTKANLVSQLLQYIEEKGPEIESWGNLSDEQQELLSQDCRNERSDYLDAITEVLESNPEGTFGNRTAIYRRVEEEWDLGKDSCRTVMYRWENEPKDEEEWRDYLNV